MARYEMDIEVLGPWSLVTSKAFWEGFAPAALTAQGETNRLRTAFCAEVDWRRVEVEVTQDGSTARVVVAGDGAMPAAAAQAGRFLSLDVDARGWPDVARRDPVMADAQAQLPGLRPCGFHSPYEAAAWSVLSQRIRIVQAARLRDDLVLRHGDEGAFPAPQVLRGLDLDLPGRKAEYLQTVAEAALEGRLDGTTARRCARSTRTRPSRRCSRSRAWAPSRPNSSSSAARTRRMRCPGTSAAWRPRSSSATAPTAPWPRSPQRGGRFAPGLPCTCAPCASNALERSAGG